MNQEFKATQQIGIEMSGEKTRLYLENIKCDGCARTISGRLSEIGIKEPSVDYETGTVEMLIPTPEKLSEALVVLHHLGYPIVDSEEGMKALALKAKSYISCAIGKMGS